MRRGDDAGGEAGGGAGRAREGEGEAMEMELGMTRMMPMRV